MSIAIRADYSNIINEVLDELNFKLTLAHQWGGSLTPILIAEREKDEIIVEIYIENDKYIIQTVDMAPGFNGVSDTNTTRQIAGRLKDMGADTRFV